MHAFDQAYCCFALSFEDHCFIAGGAAVHQRFTDLLYILFDFPSVFSIRRSHPFSIQQQSPFKIAELCFQSLSSSRK